MELINTISFWWSLIAISVFILLLFVTAPYGRHNRKGWGAGLSNKWGWFLMEVPSFLIVLYFLWGAESSAYAMLLGSLWLFHYTYRTFIFPFRLRTSRKKMPWIIALSAIGFNGMNAGLNGYYLAHLETYTESDFLSGHFILGAVLFVFGTITHQWADHKLINLRKSKNDTSYHIPKGGLFNLVSCPNMLGELTQWTGFAFMAWNWPALSFALWTAANLIPRAFKHHKWYLKNLDKYPVGRKAIFPFIR
ncbi:MAG: 3-oxo-5-alpha-steroid 4-dehydrogenase 1 [Gammaproteobacteria bacterium]|jgi:3-oxo-5-alpha-steroid 4-dehydrogenase 1